MLQLGLPLRNAGLSLAACFDTNPVGDLRLGAWAAWAIGAL